MRFKNLGTFGLFLILSQIIEAKTSSSQHSESYQPIGSLDKSISIIVTPISSDTTYFDPRKKKNEGADFQRTKNNTLYQVQLITSNRTTPELARLKVLANNKMLLIKKTDLFKQNPTCATVNGTLNCELNKVITVYQAGKYNFKDMYMKNMKVDHESHPGSSRYLPQHEAYTTALNEKITQVNKLLGANATAMLPCKNNLPWNLRTKPSFLCGFKKAQEAFTEGRLSGKISKNIMILNDFSTGGVTGRMWFLNPDGTLAQVTSRNPIEVARGEGGFGHGEGTLKTPEGALVTKPYNPPRDGNITDGVELEGLEPGNADIFGRGILLHGWDPHQATNGCLGIAGAISTRKKGHGVLGGSPPFLDQLKRGVLKDGGVLIYNLTPNKAKSCEG